MSSDISNYVNTYLNFLKLEKNYAFNTIKSYKKDLSIFQDFLKQQSLSINKIDYHLCRQYLYFLEKLNYSRKTISRNIASLRSFWKYLAHNNIISNNPWLFLSTPKIPKKLPIVLYEQEIEKIFSCFDLSHNIDRRNRALIELLYSSGFRVSEITQLNLNDLNFFEREILVKGKGNKERIVVFGKIAEKYLKLYLQNTRHIWAKKNNSALFINQQGSRITPRTVQRIIKKIKNQAHISNPITPHTFRHSFATELLNGGANLKIVQELLGHSSLSTTQIYTHLTQKNLIKTYKIHHPRA